MDTTPIANAAAELDRAIKEQRDLIQVGKRKLQQDEDELVQLQEAREKLEPYVRKHAEDEPHDIDQHLADEKGRELERPLVEAVDRFVPVEVRDGAIRWADPSEVLGVSELVEKIFRANPGRTMSFADVEAELAKLNVTRFERDQVRGAVYYGKRVGWAKQARRGQWILVDNWTPVTAGVQSGEPEPAPNFDADERTDTHVDDVPNHH